QARVASLVALAALGGRIALPSPPDPTLRGVAEMLGESVHGHVLPDEFLWESSRGVLADAVVGRRVLFLARSQPEGPRDLYRAAVRVTLEGKPIDVQRVVNLTDTPFGDEQGLVAAGQHVAYATVAFGAVQQVSMLDLAGQQAEGDGAVGRFLGRLTNLQSTGSLAGLGRTEVSANLQASSVAVRLEGGMLSVSTDAMPRAFTVSLATGEVVTRADEHLAVSSMRVPQLSKPAILWAVDTVRSVTGPEFIAWLEDNVFDARDLMKRAGHHAFGQGEEAEVMAGPVAPPPPPPPEPKVVGVEGSYADAAWPPQNLRTIWKTPAEGEGVWREPQHKFLQKNEVAGAEAAPSYFYQTHVRPDPKRPWSKVWMVAMDARQLRLGIEGGIEDPKPLTGARGEGRIPREPEVLHRAVGAFNGGFKTTHGEYGMMVARRVLLPPKTGAATIAVTEDGRAGFGSWPSSTNIPQEFVSFRQNLDPLVDGGHLNPSNRKQWGWHLHTTGMLTHRSGFCLTSAGHMVYAWGPEVTGETLGNAMIQAGCTYAVHLDMNPRHTAFAYLDARQRHQAKLLHPGMEVLPERFIVWSPKDFFYLTLRNFGPPAVEGLDMQADGGTQPLPVWAPAVFEGTTGQGRKAVSLQAFLPQRSTGRLVGAGAPIDPALGSRVLAAILPGSRQQPEGPTVTLHVGETGNVTLIGVNGEVPSGGERMSLPLLEKDGGSGERSAMCVADGAMWVARSAGQGDLVAALRKTGCEVVASLGEGTVHRAGSKQPPLDRYESQVLYMLGRSLDPGAFRWQADP
ncbi:MAG: hypothetical protein CVU63_08790, partial [Deltaproteobacteria bacterium HGW-Deltaproteobacteria-20]